MAIEPRDVLTAPGARLATLELSVGGMTCGSCAARIERTLRHQPGVTYAAVNFATAQATVAYDPAATDVRALGTAQQ